MSDQESLPPLVDTHAHLEDERFRGEVDAIIARAKAVGMVRVLVLAGGMSLLLALLAVMAARYVRLAILAPIQRLAASADAVSPPATEYAKGKFPAQKTATGPDGTSSDAAQASPSELRLEDARKLTRDNPAAVANIVKAWMNGEAPA